jgi:hypothetical protein
MNSPVRVAILSCLAAVGTALAYTDPQPPAKSQDASVQQAVRWERAKDAAAERQARVEGSHAVKPVETKLVPPENNKVADPGVQMQDGSRWERAKDRPDSRQTAVSRK